MDPVENTVSLEQAMAAQSALRATLGLGPERFPMPAFVGMISDEIEQLRASGHSDTGIAKLIAEATGQAMDASDLTRFYASPEQRRRG